MKKIFVASFGSDAGGIEKSLIEFLKLLVSDGHEVDLCLWREPGLLFNQIPPEVHLIHSASLYPGSLRKGRFSFGRMIWYLCFRIFQLMGIPTKAFKRRDGQYDIAIAYCQNGYTPYYVIDKVEANQKYLFYHHGSYSRNRWEKGIDRYYYSKYDSVITVSNANRDMLLSHMPWLNGHIQVIHNMVDEDKIRKLAKDTICENVGEPHSIVTVGRVAPEKGQFFCLMVAEYLRKHNFEFQWYFIGEGPDIEKCREYVQKKQLDGYCFFLGARVNPYPYMQQADVYVQTSSIEADPITIREAKVLKKIILASDIPPVREALANGTLGFLIPLRCEAFGEALLALFKGELDTRTVQKNLENIQSVNDDSIERIRKLVNGDGNCKKA